ncbi:hypothetical protein ASE82_14685 [Sphingomonas sp. Leaf230]|nr:hypothetical protein ASE82_14685 [Sphingomonas sp. Leaf230]
MGRLFWIEQCDIWMAALTMNAIVSAAVLFIQTLDCPDLARELVRMCHLCKFPVVLSQGAAAPDCVSPR